MMRPAFAGRIIVLVLEGSVHRLIFFLDHR